MVTPSRKPATVGALLALAPFALALVLPSWALFALSLAFANGLVVLGVATLLRTGALSFGQGLFFALGAYVAGQTPRFLGTSDAFASAALGGLAGAALAALLGPFLARFRGIFFAMLTLAFSMVFHGLLLNADWLGGSDGVSVRPATFLGLVPSGAWTVRGLYLFCAALAVTSGAVMAVVFRSSFGLAALAAGQSAIRVEYLGGSTRRISWITYVMAGALAGVGGAAAVLVMGHVAPDWAYWTRSGEFVLAAILSGHTSIIAVFATSVFMEGLRTLVAAVFPSTWQAALGLVLLLVIFLAPEGLGAVRWRRPDVLRRLRRASPRP